MYKRHRYNLPADRLRSYQLCFGYFYDIEIIVTAGEEDR
jgi:hypothetical protein